MQYVNSISHFKLRKPKTQPKRYSTFHVKYHLDWLLFINLEVCQLEVHYTEAQNKSPQHNVGFSFIFLSAQGKCQNNAIEGICKKSYFFFALLQISGWFLQFQISSFLQMHSISAFHSHFQLYIVTIATFVMITIIL